MRRKFIWQTAPSEEELLPAEHPPVSSRLWSCVMEIKRRFGGKGVSKAVNNINTVINDVLKGVDASDIYAVDAAMLESRRNQG